jgi:hypothetical protein
LVQDLLIVDHVTSPPLGRRSEGGAEAMPLPHASGS